MDIGQIRDAFGVDTAYKFTDTNGWADEKLVDVSAKPDRKIRIYQVIVSAQDAAASSKVDIQDENGTDIMPPIYIGTGGGTVVLPDLQIDCTENKALHTTGTAAANQSLAIIIQYNYSS